VSPATVTSGAQRLRDAFAKAKAQGRPALVCYLMGGDPTLDASEQLLLALDQAGADVIELGVPFSDPIADGEVLQQAALRALQAGTTLHGLLGLAGRVKGRVKAPIVLMGYCNPFFALGFERFAAEAAAVGLCGAIVPDVPLEEAGPLREALAKRGLAWVPLCAPTTGDERLAKIAAAADGFVYYVSITGVTGARAELPDDLAQRLESLHKLSPAPVAVGFGISKPEQAAALRGRADGVVVGSGIVNAHQHGGIPAAASLVRGLAEALRG
jgi:tryptophan synthase alpha chain